MFKNYLKKIIPFTIFPLAFISVQRFSSYPMGNTMIYWLIQVAILLIFWRAKVVFFETENKQAIRIVGLYLIWVLISIIRGIFIAETYWDWKALIGASMALLVPIISYAATNRDLTQAILSFFIKYTLPLSITVLPFLTIGGWGWYLFPINLLVLFWPALKFQSKGLILAISLIIIFGDLSTRSHMFKYGIPILLLFFYYTHALPWSTRLINLTRHVFLFSPWLFFLLGISGIFNIFQIDNYIQSEYVGRTKNAQGEVVEQKLAQDSRTFLYVEVLQSAQKYNYYWVGRSPARGNETEWFADEALENRGRKERLSNEAGILNIFTWTGIVGTTFYFLIFYKASNVAINQSNNIFSKLIGLFVSFRWMYAWLEDDATFNLNTFTIWLMIGICFSTSFHKMNNAEVKLWVRGVFEKNYLIMFRQYATEHIESSKLP